MDVPTPGYIFSLNGSVVSLAMFFTLTKNKEILPNILIILEREIHIIFSFYLFDFFRRYFWSFPSKFKYLLPLQMGMGSLGFHHDLRFFYNFPSGFMRTCKDSQGFLEETRLLKPTSRSSLASNSCNLASLPTSEEEMSQTTLPSHCLNIYWTSLTNTEDDYSDTVTRCLV